MGVWGLGFKILYPKEDMILIYVGDHCTAIRILLTGFPLCRRVRGCLEANGLGYRVEGGNLLAPL